MSKKGRIFSVFSRAGIKKQLYYIYTVAVVIPIVLIGAFLLAYVNHMMGNYYADLLEADNHRVRNIFFEITTQMYNVSRDIAFDENIREILTGDFSSRQEYMRAVDRNAVLDQYMKANSEISEIAIYTDNPALSDYKQFLQADGDITDKVWYQKALTQTGVFWQEVPWEYGYRNSYWDLCLVRAIPLVHSPYHAVLVIHISNNYLQMRVDSDEYISMISVDKGPVFYSSDRERKGNALPLIVDYTEPYFQYMGQTEVDGQKCFINVSTFHMYQSDSRIYICTLDPHGYGNIRRILVMCALIILLIMLIPGIVIRFFAEYFTERVGLLRQEMHKASRQDYELIPAFHGNDELSAAFEDLQVMVCNIKEQESRAYGAQLKEQEQLIRQQEMEFKMLASQINPHFLYNTLETIRMKAFAAGDKEAAKAIKLLGKTMRYVLESTGEVFTTLEEALNHVDGYMEIQHLRFGERILYEKKLEKGLPLSRYHILPLLLQPIVENAIVHGLDETEENGRIVLSVYTQQGEKERLLVIDVDDNGCGMTKAALDKLREDIETRDISRNKSIGLYNINQRMKLYYGEKYCVQVYSEFRTGTRVRLTIPLDKAQE